MIEPMLVVIAGTGTEIGKTWFATRLLTLAKSMGYSVSARKPAQSFDPAEETPTDADLLAQASGEQRTEVCALHRCYPVAMAPPMAADALKLPRIALNELIDELSWPAASTLRVLETAGGLLSPIAHDADNADLIAHLKPQCVVLVADAGLGTLNAVRLCVRALSTERVLVFLNRFDSSNPLHRYNSEWLRDKYGIDAAHEINSELVQRLCPR